MNCLTYCLEQWLDNPDFKLWYNSNHVVIIEPDKDLTGLGYLSLDEYGFTYFIKSFRMTPEYQIILSDYFDQL